MRMPYISFEVSFSAVKILDPLIKWWSSEAATKDVLWKKVFLEILQNSQENICARVSFSIKLQASGLQLNKKEILAQVFSCEFCKISKNTFFTEHLRTTASGSWIRRLFPLRLLCIIICFQFSCVNLLFVTIENNSDYVVRVHAWKSANI